MEVPMSNNIAASLKLNLSAIPRNSSKPSLTETQRSLSHSLSNIHQHCGGSLEDGAFFKNYTIPSSPDPKEMRELYTLIDEIKDSGMKPDVVNRLKTKTQQIAQNLGIELLQHRPDSFGSDTPPLATRSKLTDHTVDSSDHN